MDVTRSKRLNEKYKIIKTIGKGGMAQVYLAENRKTGIKVAIKTLIVDNNVVINKKRFKEEMRLAQHINNPNIVKFYEGYFDDQDQFIVMEFIDGVILKDYIMERGSFQVDEAVDFAKQIATGFQSIHDQGIVHRDLKSSNIMVDKTNQIKIIDFGIAITDDSARYTATNKVIGSVQYMAPELLDKQNATPQSDIYALGILMYEMLIGQPPFTGTNPLETAVKHKNNTIKPVNELNPQIPQSLANIIIKATAKNRSQRYSSMNKLYLDLETCLSQNRIKENKINLDAKPKSKLEIILKNKWIWLGCSIAILLIIIIILAVVLSVR